METGCVQTVGEFVFVKCIIIIHEYAQMIIFIYTYYRHATIGSPRLVNALHTTSILSMLDTSVSPLCLIMCDTY